MYTPKERCELLLSMLGEQLNEHGHFFKISKTRLSWKNKDVSVLIFPRGSHYSKAETTTRWLNIRIDSYAMRKLANAGAPVTGATFNRGPETLFDSDLREPGSPIAIEVALTDWWSIEQAAKHLASHLDDFWHNELAHWLSLDTAITYLSTHPQRVSSAGSLLLAPLEPEPGLTPLFTTDASAPDPQNLIDELKLEEKEWRLNLIAEFLLASNRDEDFWRIVELGAMCQDQSKYMNTEHRGLMALADWKRSSD